MELGLLPVERAHGDGKALQRSGSTELKVYMPVAKRGGGGVASPAASSNILAMITKLTLPSILVGFSTQPAGRGSPPASA